MPLFVYDIYPPDLKGTHEVVVIAKAELGDLGPRSGTGKVMAGTFGMG